MKTLRKLSDAEIDLLKKNYEVLEFKKDFDLVYESQIPSAGIVFLEGEMHLLKRKKLRLALEPGTILGIKNLLQDEPSNLGCKILGLTKLILIPRSDILSLIKDSSSELYRILKPYY